jgi:hypothetical protein
MRAPPPSPRVRRPQWGNGDGPAALCYPAPVRKLSVSLAIASFGAALAVASPALADASAWVFVGGGVLGWKQAEYPTVNTSGSMVFDVGAGTSPTGRFIFGGLFRIQPVFEYGVDLALLTRFCTRGFQVGDWGFAIDAGGFARPWGVQSIGFSGSASLGTPLGFQLTLLTEIGTDKAYSFGAVAGIDLLRLTVYRQTLLKWWQNPSPPNWSNAQTAGTGGGGVRF